MTAHVDSIVSLHGHLLDVTGRLADTNPVVAVHERDVQMCECGVCHARWITDGAPEHLDACAWVSANRLVDAHPGAFYGGSRAGTRPVAPSDTEAF